MYGGRSKDFIKEKTRLSSTIHTFNVYLESWREARTEGPTPSGLYGGACASLEHNLYIYGGSNGDDWRQGSLHQLDTVDLKWTRLATAGRGPMKKHGSQMVFNGEQLVLFGGHGQPSGPIQRGAEFVQNDRYTDGRGWSNELHVFDFKEGTEDFRLVEGVDPKSVFPLL